jgi:hypothetical protein
MLIRHCIRLFETFARPSDIGTGTKSSDIPKINRVQNVLTVKNRTTKNAAPKSLGVFLPAFTLILLSWRCG